MKEKRAKKSAVIHDTDMKIDIVHSTKVVIIDHQCLVMKDVDEKREDIITSVKINKIEEIVMKIVMKDKIVQSAYHPNHVTETASLKIVSDVLDAENAGHIT